MKKVISTRLEPEMVAKARDGLNARGYSLNQLATVSNVVRLTFLHGLASLMTSQQEINVQPSEDSLIWMQQKLNQTKHHNKTLDLNDLIQGNKS